MATFDPFLKRLLPRVMGCADPVARQAIFDAAVEFCERSGAFKHVTAPLHVEAGQHTVTVPVPPDTAVTLVREVWFNGRPLHPAADDAIQNVMAYGYAVEGVAPQVGTPQDYFWLDDQLHIFPAPELDSPASLVVRVSLKPVEGADTPTTFPEV